MLGDFSLGKSGRLPVLLLGISLWLAPIGSAQASSIVYQPVDPAFGGNPLNGPNLLGVANAQNNYTPPATPGSGPTSVADQFAQALQSRLLSALADDITAAIFGNNPQQSGTIVFGDQTVHFSRGLDSVELDINNTVTGEKTTISVPLLVSGPRVRCQWGCVKRSPAWRPWLCPWGLAPARRRS